MRAHRLRAAAVGVLVVSTSASAAAQSEKITLNVVPPLHGSTVRYDMRHELTLQATPEGAIALESLAELPGALASTG